VKGCGWRKTLNRLLKNTHLSCPWRDYPHPASLRRTGKYAALLGIRPAACSGMGIFQQPANRGSFNSLLKPMVVFRSKLALLPCDTRDDLQSHSTDLCWMGIPAG
jgi:hypothetical protein